MAKEIKKKEPEAPKLFPKEDRLKIKHLMGQGNLGTTEAHMTVDMYRKYINPNQPVNWSTSCNACGNSVSALFYKLRDWWSVNNTRFEV